MPAAGSKVRTIGMAAVIWAHLSSISSSGGERAIMAAFRHIH
jgi:hypothetical protein